MMRSLALVAVLLAATAVPGLEAQSRRPQAELMPSVETARITPGADVRLTLRVRLPEKFHVQSNKPRDPLLIPTVLTVEVPKGLMPATIVYPKATDLKQAGQKELLAVFEREFTIDIRLKVSRDARPGAIVVPGQLRYQACDETTCYAPLRAEAKWTLNVVDRVPTAPRAPATKVPAGAKGS